eukprot:gene4027-5038_t
MRHRIELEDYQIEFLNFEDRDARCCFWESSSILLARSIQQYYSKLYQDVAVSVIDSGIISNAIESNAGQGAFFVDVHFSNPDITIKEDDLVGIKKIMEQLAKSDEPIQLVKDTPKHEALHLLSSSPLLQGMVEKDRHSSNGTSTGIDIIKCGEFATLPKSSKLPTIASTGVIKAIDLIKNSSVVGEHRQYSNLQRIVGVSFPEKAQLESWHESQRLAALRDHRVIGRDQELFFFHPYSPGSCFFLPRGTRIYNKLLEFLRAQYRIRGYEEVITPNIYSQKLWETSGHWQNYKENMFQFECDHTNYSMKPMNCPGHCLLFSHRARSYKELPLRIADFGALHRNETHGSLTGLTRVRRFQQDDAHIFCTRDMIKDEMRGCLSFMQYVYKIFGFEFHLELSTRPTPFLGDVSVWDEAEKSLTEVLNEFCGDRWRVNPGDGAFYGPKIDIHLKDANGKSHQCATIQLDFQLPIRFNLEYQSDNPNQPTDRPVMIHRALFGSVERMLAILMEHTGGKWPFWLSPRQCLILPVSSRYSEYAQEVASQLEKDGYYVDIDMSDAKKLPKKLRDGILLQYNYILVVGQEELDTKTVSVRKRDSEQQHPKISINDLLIEFKDNIINFK